jgi:hypothetical protein
MAVVQRFVTLNEFFKISMGPGRRYTPCIPVLMHTSREARQIALELYEIFRRPPTDHIQFGPIYFNFKLDILAAVSWNGKCLSETSISCFPNILKKKVRHVAMCDWEVQYILGSKDLRSDSINNTSAAVAYTLQAYQHFYELEALETILVMHPYRTPRQSPPWKMNIVKDTDPVAQDGRDVRSDCIVQLLPWWMEVLKVTESLYPSWKAPKIGHL